MIFYEGKVVTFKHFLFNPRLAAIAGYDFNILDVVSWQVHGLFFNSTRDILSGIIELLYARVIDLPKEIFQIMLAIVVYVLCVCFFPFLNVYAYCSLKRNAKKHKGEYKQEILQLIWHVDNRK